MSNGAEHREIAPAATRRTGSAVARMAGARMAGASMTGVRAARLAAKLTLTACLVVGLAGCGGRGGLRSAFGVTLEQPDAFNVLPRSPLRLPSNFQNLPAPQPGAPSPLDPAPVAEARATLGKAEDSRGAPSAAELVLLNTAGAEAADPAIREKLAAEKPEGSPRYGLTELLGYKVPDGSTEDILDQREEAKRILANGGLTPTPPPVKDDGTSSNSIIMGVF
jgi:hypothetical protein